MTQLSIHFLNPGDMWFQRSAFGDRLIFRVMETAWLQEPTTSGWLLYVEYQRRNPTVRRWKFEATRKIDPGFKHSIIFFFSPKIGEVIQFGPHII